MIDPSRKMLMNKHIQINLKSWPVDLQILKVLYNCLKFLYIS